MICLNTIYLFAMEDRKRTSLKDWFHYSMSFFKTSPTEQIKQEPFLPSAPPAYMCLEDSNLYQNTHPLNNKSTTDKIEYVGVNQSLKYEAPIMATPIPESTTDCYNNLNTELPTETDFEEIHESLKTSIISQWYSYFTDTINGIDVQVINELEVNKFDLSNYMQAMHRLDYAIQLLVSKENNSKLRYLLGLCVKRQIIISDTGRNIALSFIKRCKQKEIERTTQEFKSHLENIRLIKDDERMLLALHSKKDDISDTEYDEDLLFGKTMVILNRVKGKGKRK